MKQGGSEEKSEEPQLQQQQKCTQAPAGVLGSPSASAASSIPSSAVASLIQSAAKSLDRPDAARRNMSTGGGGDPQEHDAAVATKLFDDDEYVINNSSSLASLEKETLPPMPDEQDRKRFVGCLAAVLTSLYDYDDYEDDDVDDMTQQSSHHQQQDMNQDLGSSFYEDDDDDAYLDTSGGGSASNGSSPKKASSSGGIRRKKLSEAARTAQTRHRRRRFEVFSRFLANSAELLLLDPNQSKCFLPMLGKLLEPATTTTTKKKRTSPKKQAQNNNNNSNMTSSYTHAMDFFVQQMDQIEHLRSFMEELGPGAGLRCLAMFLLQHLLHSSEGYDARVRNAIKTLGVLVLLHDILLQQEAAAKQGLSGSGGDVLRRRNSGEQQRHRKDNDSSIDLVMVATRKFESMEHFIASKLIQLSRAQRELEEGKRGGGKPRLVSRKSSGNLGSGRGGGGDGSTSTRQHFMRGLKIGGTAVAAGTIFAITGGLAAPGIAAGIAAVAGTTAVATAAAALTSTAAVTTIFGVGGGGMVAYKMQRRTVGLTEFEFTKETRSQDGASDDGDPTPDAELFSTICISGWLRDDCDFQRPWGCSPTCPPIDDLMELLERFYSVHRPGHVPKCNKILASWRGEEQQLWQLLRQNYGRDPHHLFPLEDGPRHQGSLTHEQEEVVSNLFAELGCTIPSDDAQTPTPNSPLERMRGRYNKGANNADAMTSGVSLFDSPQLPVPPCADELDYLPEGSSDAIVALSTQDGNETSQDADSSRFKHLATVWDYQATYGGELYTIRWESDLIHELCASVVDLAADVVTGAGTQLLKFTALSTLVAAMAIPYALKSAANMIDGTWTLVVERSEAAGKELAQSLLFSSAGNRPVTLVGFSFGARVIYTCLKELARYQEKWEDYRDSHQGHKVNRRRKGKAKDEGDEELKNMREPASIVGDVVLMGLPNHLSQLSWKACRQVVAGRLVNCFSQKDLILSLMFQIKKFGLKPVCGTCQVNVAGVENIDVTDLVLGHQDYCFVAGDILKRVRHGQPFPSDAASFLFGFEPELEAQDGG